MEKTEKLKSMEINEKTDYQWHLIKLLEIGKKNFGKDARNPINNLEI